MSIMEENEECCCGGVSIEYLVLKCEGTLDENMDTENILLK
jgi:hypothetical protein